VDYNLDDPDIDGTDIAEDCLLMDKPVIFFTATGFINKIKMKLSTIGLDEGQVFYMDKADIGQELIEKVNKFVNYIPTQTSVIRKIRYKFSNFRIT
jgi:hypothetical protein